MLALAGGLHAALIGVLLAEAARRPPAGVGARQAFLLVPVPVRFPVHSPPRTAVPPPLPSTQPPKAARAIRPSPARPSPQAAHVPAPAADDPAAPLAAPQSLSHPATAPDPFAPSPAATPSLAERARRDAARIARELGPQVAPGVLAPGGGKQFDRAFQGRTFGFTLDRYVSPDGTSMTRETRGNRVKCYIPEPYQPGIIPRSSERQREVNCAPDNAGWKRH